MNFLCVLFVSGFLFVHTSPVEQTFPFDFFADSGNANEFVDQVLAAVKAQFGKKLEVFDLPDKTLKFERKVGIITLEGSVHLTQGTLRGLSTLHRQGSATIGTENGAFTAHVTIGLEHLKAHYKANVEFMHLLHKNLDFNADIGVTDINLVLTIDPATSKPVLKELHMLDLEKVHLDIHGLGIFDHVVDAVGEAFIALFNPQIRHIMDNVLKDMISEQMKNFKLGGTF